MFEHPAWLALLFLAVPWILFWPRRRAPRPWPVGGLDPFAALPPGGGARRRWPPSLFAALAALALGVVAVAGPRRTAPGVVLLDASLSMPRGRQDEALAAVRAFGEDQGGDLKTVLLGSQSQAVAEAEIFRALRRFAGVPLLVVTDRPRPRGLPALVGWKTLSWSGGNAAILNVYSGQAAGEWRVHWMQWGLAGPLELAVNGKTVRSLSGDEGIESLTALPPRARLELRRPGGEAPDAHPRDDAWTLPPVIRRVLLPAGAGPQWERTVRALWPQAEPVADPPCDLEIGLGPAPARSKAPRLLLPEDPFGKEGEPEAVVEVARKAAPFLEVPAPRPRSECRPDPTPAVWPAGEKLPPVNRSGQALARALAGLGGLLFLLALLLRGQGW